MAKKRMRLPPRDKAGRFTKRAKKVRKKSAPALSVKRGVPARGGREFIQRYFIDKFKKGKKTEYEVWTIASKGTPPLQSKKQVIKKVESIV
ncbi:MAG: hypothetical protein PVI03_01445 [Candidatus Thorarchaeota archaeon]|jgi:hypothetical protein